MAACRRCSGARSSPRACVAFVLLIFFTCGTAFAIRWSGKDSYSTAAALLYVDLFKIAVCLLYHRAAEQSWRVLFGIPWRTAFVPACLFTLQTQLLLFAGRSLDTFAYVSINQLKVVPTAIFSYSLIEGRKYSLQQIASLFLLTAGVTLVVTGVPRTGGASGAPALALAAMGAASISSGYASVLVEMMLKGANAELATLNIQLSACSVAVALPQVVVLCLSTESLSAFTSLHKYAWLVVVLQAAGGILVSLVVKHTSQVMKAFATAFAVVLTFLIDLALHNVAPASLGATICGVAAVALSFLLYSGFVDCPSPELAIFSTLLVLLSWNGLTS